MKKTVQDAIDMGTIKSTAEIRLNNDAKKLFKEGIIYENIENNVNIITKTTDNKKVIEREQFSNYIFPPLKRSISRPRVG